MNKSEYFNELQSRGWELLGKGLYANVFAIPNTDKVIKVAKHDTWPAYIHWATENGYAGKFAPKVYSLKFHNGFYTAIMERLVDTVNGIKEGYGYDSDWRKNPLIELHNSIHSWPREPTDADDFEAFFEDLRANHFTGDLHDQNVMVRKDGQLVVTDPASGSRSYRFRMKSGKIL